MAILASSIPQMRKSPSKFQGTSCWHVQLLCKPFAAYLINPKRAHSMVRARPWDGGSLTPSHDILNKSAYLWVSHRDPACATLDFETQAAAQICESPVYSAHNILSIVSFLRRNNSQIICSSEVLWHGVIVHVVTEQAVVIDAVKIDQPLILFVNPSGGRFESSSLCTILQWKGKEQNSITWDWLPSSQSGKWVMAYMCEGKKCIVLTEVQVILITVNIQIVLLLTVVK